MNLEFELDRLKRHSEAAWARLDYERSEELLRQRQKLSPRDPQLLLDLGCYSGMRYDYAMATEYFEKAIRLSGWNPAAFATAGLHCLKFSQPLMSRNYLERGLKKYPEALEILSPLARIYERLGQFAAAEEFALRALKKDAYDITARLVLATVLRRDNRLIEAESILRGFVSRPGVDVVGCAHVGYELGLNLDQQGRYAEAMKEFVKAKQSLVPMAHQQRARLQSIQKQRLADAAAYTGQTLQHFCGEAEKLTPLRRIAFLVGHPRSGTTLLEQILEAHAEAVSSSETTIFTREATRILCKALPQYQQLIDVLNHSGVEQLQKARATYFCMTESFLGQPLAGRLHIDKNPSLTEMIPAITRIFPEAKFLIALRDPRDVCISCFMQPLPINPISSAYLTLADTVSEYVSTMGCWLNVRDKMAASWLEVRYEDMVEDLEPVARRTLEFLGLPWDDRVLAFHQHAKNKIVKSPTYADVVKPIYKRAKGRWHNYHKYLEPHLKQLEPFVKALGYD
jgi:tetratricopeptide (TPR) repeat protein